MVEKEVLLFVTKLLVLDLYLIELVLDVFQVLWVLELVLVLANIKSTCTWLKYFEKYLTPTQNSVQRQWLGELTGNSQLTLNVLNESFPEATRTHLSYTVNMMSVDDMAMKDTTASAAVLVLAHFYRNILGSAPTSAFGKSLINWA